MDLYLIFVFGVMINSCLSLSAFIYSENSSSITSELKFVVPVIGLARISVGGIVSFGPPVGLPGLAHL